MFMCRFIYDALRARDMIILAARALASQAPVAADIEHLLIDEVVARHPPAPSCLRLLPLTSQGSSIARTHV